jgi:hypothetical protein
MAPSNVKRGSETPAPEAPGGKRPRRGAKADTPTTPVKKERSEGKASASTSPARGRQECSEAFSEFGSEEVVLCHPDAMKLFGEVQVALYAFLAC